VPKGVRREIEKALGAPVVRAARIWGGYGPSPTFRLKLVDGRRAFFKAINAHSNEFSTAALRAETQVYLELGDLLKGWMPTYYATIAQDDWHGLLLEDLGPKSAPPWKPGLARGVAHALARFHLATRGLPLPMWLSRPLQSLSRESWARTVAESDNLRLLATWAGEAAPEALAWLHEVGPLLQAKMAHPSLMTEPFSLLHGDLRSDNLRFRQGELRLFDWPAITVGRAEWDTVAFAQSVTVEGGIAPERVMEWYGEIFPLEEAAVEAALAWWFVYFAHRSWRDEIPGLPRVRPFQRQQLGVLAQWAARQWSLPEPTRAAYLKGV
jgi:fructosamine-3-kinase